MDFFSINISSLRIFITIVLILTSRFLYSQGTELEQSIYTKQFDKLMSNEYLQKLFQHSTLNIDSSLKHIKPSKPFHPENGQQLLEKTEKKIPLSYSEKVAFFINLYSKGANQHFLNYLINYYEPIITHELNKQELPTELALLPAVLSNFNPHSKNSIGGEGYWHLNYPQAIKYGLVVSNYVDERKNITKSTIASTLYLKQLYSQYNNWELTLTAFVYGPTTINNLIHRKKTSDYTKLYPYLNSATRDVVPAFYALIYTHTTNNSNHIKIDPKFNTDTLQINKKLAFKAIEDVAGVNQKEMQFLNPTIINATFPKGYQAILPKNSTIKLNSLVDSIYFYQDSILYKPIIEKTDETTQQSDTSYEPTTYRVKSGDVLGTIADKNNVKISQLQEWNNLKNTIIRVGQQLIIYKKIVSKNQTAIVESDNSNSNHHPDDFFIYTVKSGDNLWDIAKNYPANTAEEIMEINNIDENIKIGQLLKLKKK